MQDDLLNQAMDSAEISRIHYDTIYDGVPIACLALTEAGLIVTANQASADLLLERKGALKFVSVFDFIAPDDRDRWEWLYFCALKGQDRGPIEVIIQRKDGSRFNASIEAQREKLIGGLIALHITITDITECKIADAELRIAAMAFESQQGMIITDTLGRIIRTNSAFTRLTGFSAEEVIGQRPSILQSGRHDKAFYEGMWQTIKEEGYWQGEVWNRRKNGRIYAEWLTISAVAGTDGTATNYVGTFSEITENKEAQAEIHRLAHYDSLTHLPNRRLLVDRIGQAMASSQRCGRYGALIFLDLDDFKVLNDTRGHDLGDKLLVLAAQRIQSNLRLNDTVARLGGDEFVVMLEDLSTAAEEAAIQTRHVVEKIREALSVPYDLDGREYRCTASIGVKFFVNQDESVETLLKHADLAMYRAKGAGRNMHCFFDPAMQAALDERTSIEADLRLAVERKELRLFYQPQVDGAGRLVGAEALVRWQHPQKGLVPPNDFIPLAEETGLILSIGRWVLTTACHQIKAWSSDPATRDLKLAVNVSLGQFRLREFIDEIQSVLSETGADANRLKIELTESLMVTDIDDTTRKMRALKVMGVSVSMDDFGTGYSSLAYLLQLPLDQLKIDRSFVINLPENPRDAIIAQTIVSMARSLSLDVIAEGVETQAQVDFLMSHGCETFQGYLFSRPLPADEFDRFAGTCNSHGVSAGE